MAIIHRRFGKNNLTYKNVLKDLKFQIDSNTLIKNLN